MDNLEKFILEHREEFDAAVPSLKVWADIDRRLDRQPVVRRIVWMQRLRAAACVALLLAAGGVLGAYLASSPNQPKALADLSPEYAETERHFQEQVSEKMAQLASYRQDGYVRGDMQELDELYRELQEELKAALPSTRDEERIIQAMIENYQTKVNILEQVLEKVQTTNPTNLKTEENEVSL